MFLFFPYKKNKFSFFLALDFHFTTKIKVYIVHNVREPTTCIVLRMVKKRKMKKNCYNYVKIVESLHYTQNHAHSMYNTRIQHEYNKAWRHINKKVWTHWHRLLCRFVIHNFAISYIHTLFHFPHTQFSSRPFPMNAQLLLKKCCCCCLLACYHCCCFSCCCIHTYIKRVKIGIYLHTNIHMTWYSDAVG